MIFLAAGATCPKFMLPRVDASLAGDACANMSSLRPEAILTTLLRSAFAGTFFPKALADSVSIFWTLLISVRTSADESFASCCGEYKAPIGIAPLSFIFGYYEFKICDRYIVNKKN
jgi:hypothetical protein